MKKTKDITTLALFMAIHIAISMFYIPVADNLRIYFTYIIVMLLAIIYPPKVVFIYAIFEDLIAFMIAPSGTFFIGYTITAVVGMMIYSFFLHKEVSVLRIVLAKTLANVIANIGLNSLWSSMLYSKGFIYYLSTSVIKNIALLPFEIIIFISFYRTIRPPLVKHGFINSNEKQLNLKIFKGQ